ncbi:MAG: DUF2225 domain-containing protein, partial [Planctomycetes bacterium]|nr:DUF2225 domain-containing protein [Planctomycetota bacterium]
MKKSLLVLVMALLVGIAGAADKKAPAGKTPPGFKLPPAEVVMPKPGETLPPLGQAFKKTHKNLCPSCGRDRSLCYAESMKAKKTGQGKVCDVYRDDYVSGAPRPVACPVCRHMVNLPQRNQRYEHTDSDLCPHPDGNVRFMSELATCPKCGYSAFRGDFFAAAAPVRAWVQQNLQPHMAATLHQILGRETKITDAQLVELFSAQKDIPDTLRCKNAFAIYSERLRQGDKKISTGALARMAWMTAWAHRRAISEPFGEGILLEGARRVLAAIKKAEVNEDQQEEGIRLLTGLYRDKEHYDIVERQIMRLIQAGYYNRLGLNFWAEGVLRQVVAEVGKKYSDPGADPWQKVRAVADLKGAEREKAIALAKNALTNAANVRLMCLKGELEYLGYAIDLIVKGMEKREIPALEVPTYFYLVGDFERRRENHSRALFWLQAAAQLCGSGEVRLEHCAPEQIDLMKR